MLQDVMQSPEPLCIEGLSSPIAAQILDYCDDGDLFGESLQSSEVSSCSATGRGSGSGGGATITTPNTATTTVTTGSSGGLCCFDDGSFASDFSPFSDMDEATLSALLDDPQQLPPNPDPDIASYPSTQPVYPPYMSKQSEQLILSDSLDGNGGTYTPYSPGTMVQLAAAAQSQQPAVLVQQLPPVYEEDCLTPLPLGYMDHPSSSTSCSFLDAAGFYQLGGLRVPLCGAQGDGGGQMGFYGGMMSCPEPGMASQDLREYPKEDCGGVGIYGSTESMHPVYSSGDLQVIGDGQNLVGRCSAAPLPASDITALDESSFKVGRLSVEERKEKIHRYMKKRNERNFSKKIKYACRKTLADSRPRVRGRFAKNDEFGEATARPSSSHHEFDDEEEVVVKEEDDMLDSSDILAHISGVNSFKYNYTLESWI